MNIINNSTVSVSTSDELKNVLENDNGYYYIYLENDITLNSGISINSKKSKIIINGCIKYKLDNFSKSKWIKKTPKFSCIKYKK